MVVIGTIVTIDIVGRIRRSGEGKSPKRVTTGIVPRLVQGALHRNVPWVVRGYRVDSDLQVSKWNRILYVRFLPKNKRR